MILALSEKGDPLLGKAKGFCFHLSSSPGSSAGGCPWTVSLPNWHLCQLLPLRVCLLVALWLGCLAYSLCLWAELRSSGWDMCYVSASVRGPGHALVRKTRKSPSPNKTCLHKEVLTPTVERSLCHILKALISVCREQPGISWPIRKTRDHLRDLSIPGHQVDLIISTSQAPPHAYAIHQEARVSVQGFVTL